MTKRVRIIFLLATMVINSCSAIYDPVTPKDIPVKPALASLSAKDFTGLEKEYSAFKTKSASQAYIKKKLDLWLDTVNNGASIKGPQLLREVEFARIKGETEIPLKALFASVAPAALYTKVATASAITTAISQGNAPLDVFINVTVNPFPAVPSGLSADTITPNGFTARWGTITGATAYEITVNNLAPVNVGLATSYVANVTGTGHTFKVKAVKGLAAGNDSTTFNVPAIPATPVILTTDAITYNSFKANWNTVPGATSYEIIIDSNSAVTTTNTFYNASGLTGTPHSFQVRAINAATSATGDYSALTNVTLPPSYINSNIVLNLDAGNPTSYPSPFNGTTWMDISGKGNNGTLVNGPLFNPVNGGVLDFDGNNDYVRVPQSNNYKFGTGDFSLDIWFKTNDITNANGGLFDRVFFMGNSVYVDSLSFNISTPGRIDFRWNDTVFQSSNQVLATNTWYNFTFTRTGNTIKMYFNGVLNTTTTWTNTDVSTAGNHNILIFNANDALNGGPSGSGNAAGKAGAVKLYNKELVLSEVQQNYNALKGRFGL